MRAPSKYCIPGLPRAIVITMIGTCGLGLLKGCLRLTTLNVMFVNNAVGLVYAFTGYLLFAVFEVEAKKPRTVEVF